MNEGGIESANDEDEDIYKDIGDFRFDRELSKLEESNKAYTEDIARLSKKLNELTERNEALQNINEILATNISILLKTAKQEIDRKQRVIDEFRTKIETLNSRHGRNERISSLRSESSRKPSNEVSKGHYKMSDIEDGEIVGDDCVENKFFNNARRRDDSNSRDRGYHSNNHRNRQESHEKLKGRSNDTSSRHRKSRYPDENYSRHSSSSRSHRRSTSPEKRGHSDNRIRSGDKIRSSGHSHGSRNRKSDTSPLRKEQPSRNSREKRQSIPKTDSDKLKKVGSADHGREEKPNKPDCINKDKSSTVKPCGTKKETKDVKNEENCSVVKTLSIAEYRRRKCSDGSSEKKNECDLLARRSVLADLYDEPADSKIPTEMPNDIEDKKDGTELQNNDRLDWPIGNSQHQLKTKESHVMKGPRTLYSRRMEAKFQQQQLLQGRISQKCLQSSSETQMDKETDASIQEKSEQTAEVNIKGEKITTAVEATEKDGEIENNGERTQAGKEEVKNVDRTPEETKEVVCDSMLKSTEVNPDQSFGESLVKKLVQMQATKGNVGINEFSPLKNNYKLSKISPLKPVSKQHILEYYNLKPSPQQLTNIEPEVLDFSFSLPETPGKNCFNCFLHLNDTKECPRQEENSNNEKDIINNAEEENQAAAEGKSGSESGIDDLITVTKPVRAKKRNCKTVKVNPAADEVSKESKKSVQTSDEEGGLGKSYNTRYHIRTRSKAENEKINTNESEDVGEKVGGRCRSGGEEDRGLKRERRLSLSGDIELGLAPKRMKCETPKTENDPSSEVVAEATVPDDITSFEVFRSVSDENVGNLTKSQEQVARVEEKSVIDDLPAWNGGAYTAKTASNEDQTAETIGDKMKPSLSSTGYSGDSSTFKVLRSYVMLSANDDSDDEAFSSGSSSGSGEYSDSGASALVDLL